MDAEEVKRRTGMFAITIATLSEKLPEHRLI